MIEYKVDYNEIESMRGLLLIYPKIALPHVTKALYKSAIEVQNIARGEAPTRTGKLRNSIMFQIHGLTAVISPKVDYAVYVEGGTGLYGPNKTAIVPKNKKVLATKINPGFGQKTKSGYFIIGKKSSGQKANPFFKRTWAVTPQLVKMNFAGARNDIIRDLAKQVS